MTGKTDGEKLSNMTLRVKKLLGKMPSHQIALLCAGLLGTEYSFHDDAAMREALTTVVKVSMTYRQSIIDSRKGKQ